MDCQCEYCNVQSETVETRHAMTAYVWDGEGEDPNRDLTLCDDCWESYRSHWQEMWDEYYRGLGV